MESHKTVSRKAQSKQSSKASSRANSAVNSRVASKNVSRAGSDDEEGGNLSDETSFSVNSMEEMLTVEDTDQPSEEWRTELADKMEETIDRKRSSVQGREITLATYVRILTSHYAEEEIRGKKNDLVASFLKSIKAEASEKETVLALKGKFDSAQ